MDSDEERRPPEANDASLLTTVLDTSPRHWSTTPISSPLPRLLRLLSAMRLMPLLLTHALLVTAATSSGGFVDVQIMEGGLLRRFAVSDLRDSSEIDANAGHFCIAHGASTLNSDCATCVEQVVGALEGKYEGRSITVRSGISLPLAKGAGGVTLPSDAEVSERVRELLAARSAETAGEGTAPFSGHTSPTRLVTTTASVAASVALRTCDKHGLPPRGVFCEAVMTNIAEEMRRVLVTELFRHLVGKKEATESDYTEMDIFVGFSSDAGVLTNTALLADTAWASIFDHEARRQRSRGGSRGGSVGYATTLFSAADLLNCADDRWGCRACNRCFHVVARVDAAADAAADTSALWRLPIDTPPTTSDGGGTNQDQRSNDAPSSPAKLPAPVRYCRDQLLQEDQGLLGLRRENRWMQFVDGKSHSKGEFAYERESAVPEWFFNHHGANGTDDLWSGNSSYNGLWHNAVSNQVTSVA